MQQATLAQILIDDTDIECSDWERQKFILTELAASRIRAGPFLWSRTFIATLGEERLFGGVIVHAFYPSVVRYPVLCFGLTTIDREEIFLFLPHLSETGSRLGSRSMEKPREATFSLCRNWGEARLAWGGQISAPWERPCRPANGASAPGPTAARPPGGQAA